MTQEKTDRKVKVAVTMEVEEGRMQDMLTNALEGGSNYWYTITEFVYPEGQSEKTMPLEFRHIELPFIEGGALMIGDREDEDSKPKRLDRSSLLSGLLVMAQKYTRHFSDMLTENDDATTADVYLQCCLFGEVIYG